MIGGDKVLTVVKWDKKTGRFSSFALSGCTWVNKKDSSLASDGHVKKSDHTTARLPISKESRSIQKGDLVILGIAEIPDEAKSFGELKTIFPNHMTVNEIQISDIGSRFVNHVRIAGD